MATATATVTYTRNGNAVARNSLSYLAVLEKMPVDKFRAALKRKGVKDFDAPFSVTLPSGTVIAAVAAKKASVKKSAA